MSLQKKCLTASAVTHGLLLLLVFVGSAFIPQPPKIQGPEFQMVDIPDELLAELNVMSGGGPNAGSPQNRTPPVAPPAVPKQEPVIPKVEPQPKPPEPSKDLPKPEPEKVPEPKVERPKPVEPEAFDLSKTKTITKEQPKAPKPPKPEKEFNLAKAEARKIKPSTQTKTTSSARDNENSERANASKAAAALASALRAVEGTGGRVGINPDAILGPGGKAAMSYDLAVALIYEREFKRRPLPSRASDPAVEVEVVVRRDGAVLDSRITKPSRRPQLDRTVGEVLKNVNRVREFPSDITSETRTIKINFNLDPTTRG